MRIPTPGPITTARNEARVGVDMLAFFPGMMLLALGIGVAALDSILTGRIIQRVRNRKRRVF